MRLIEFTILQEGGNVFRDANKVPVTTRIKRADVDSTLAWLEPIVGLQLVDHKLGTTGKKETSGDLDIAVDESSTSKDDIVAKLAQWVAINKPNDDIKQWVKKSGINVHFKTPINGNEANGYVQTDLMFGDTEWLQFQMAGPDETSEFTGMHRAIMIGSIAKPMGMKFTSMGLVRRDTDEVVTKDPTKIAQTLLGGNATVQDMKDVESINTKLKANRASEYDTLVADAVAFFAKAGLTLP